MHVFAVLRSELVQQALPVSIEHGKQARRVRGTTALTRVCLSACSFAVDHAFTSWAISRLRNKPLLGSMPQPSAQAVRETCSVGSNPTKTSRSVICCTCMAINTSSSTHASRRIGSDAGSRGSAFFCWASVSHVLNHQQAA